MSKLTLVTGLWDIKRDQLGEGWSRSFDHYLEKFDQLLKVDNNMIIFGEESLRDFVFERRSPENTLFVSRSTEWFKNEFYGKVEIKLVKGKLQLFFEHHPTNIGTLEHIADNRFWCTYSDKVCGAEPLYVKLENNAVKSVIVKVNDFIDYISYEFVKEQ